MRSALRLFAPPPLTPGGLRAVLDEVEAAAGSQRVLLLPALAGVERGLARAGRDRLDPGLLPWLVRLHREALHACAPGAAKCSTCRRARWKSCASTCWTMVRTGWNWK